MSNWIHNWHLQTGVQTPFTLLTLIGSLFEISILGVRCFRIYEEITNVGLYLYWHPEYRMLFVCRWLLVAVGLQYWLYWNSLSFPDSYVVSNKQGSTRFVTCLPNRRWLLTDVPLGIFNCFRIIWLSSWMTLTVVV